MQPFPSLFGCLLTALLIPLAGCNKHDTIAVTPTFMYDGAPLKMASVMFIRSDGDQGRPALGMTDDMGRTQLTTYQRDDGVPPGNYRVVVIKSPENPMTFTSENADLSDPKELARVLSKAVATPPGRNARRVLSVIPEVYSDPGSTPLTCTISDDSEELVFELKSKP